MTQSETSAPNRATEPVVVMLDALSAAADQSLAQREAAVLAEARAKLLTRIALGDRANSTQGSALQNTARRNAVGTYSKGLVSGLVIAAALLFAYRVAYRASRADRIASPPANPLVVIGDNLAERAGREGEWLDGRDARALRSSHGSRLQLAPNSRVLVAHTAQPIALDVDGWVGSDFARDEGPWTMNAGPFVVSRAESAFAVQMNVQWSANSKSFRMEMLRGDAYVEGPKLGPGRRHVRQGEIVEVSLAADGATLAATPARVESAPSDVRNDALPGARQNRATRTAISQVVEPSAGASQTTTCDAMIVDALVATGTLTELEALASRCRQAHSRLLSARVLQAIRTRFLGTSEGADAAFGLARLIASDDPARALSLLRAYQEEQPDGAFAREALGRALELEHGQSRVALARLYAARFPDGPHRTLAREVLTNASGDADD